uniref:Membrane spanning 4-domains A2 n=1 Tax=Sus scrofa TaxID=9823 RepID=A0A8D1IHT8_PIG
MDTEGRSRTDLALPEPQRPSSASEIELSEVPLHENVLQEEDTPPPPRRTWLTFLKKELEFLGVTQILVGLICLYFGTIVCSMLNISEFKEDFFSSFKAGYPFWGAALLRGMLGANTISSIAAGVGTVILIINLKKSSSYASNCRNIYENDFCSTASFSTEIVAMILFLTILGFCSAVLLTIYGVREILERNKIPEDRLYEEVNIYSPIYSELEERKEIASAPDS